MKLRNLNESCREAECGSFSMFYHFGHWSGWTASGVRSGPERLSVLTFPVDTTLAFSIISNDSRSSFQKFLTCLKPDPSQYSTPSPSSKEPGPFEGMAVLSQTLPGQRKGGLIAMAPIMFRSSRGGPVSMSAESTRYRTKTGVASEIMSLIIATKSLSSFTSGVITTRTLRLFFAHSGRQEIGTATTARI